MEHVSTTSTVTEDIFEDVELAEGEEVSAETLEEMSNNKGDE